MKEIVFNARVLTPVFIESGEKITPLEYYIKEEKINEKNKRLLFYFSIIDLLSTLSDEERKEYERVVASQNITDLRDLVKRLLESRDASKFTIFKVAVGEKFYQEYENNINSENNQLEVNLFYRNKIDKAVYIPGSSIKGSIRTAILNYLYNNKSPQEKNILIKEFRRRHDSRKVEADLLNAWNYNNTSLDPQKDIFRYFIVNDISIGTGKTYIFSIQNYQINKKRKIGIKIFSEGITFNVEFQIKILITKDDLRLGKDFIDKGFIMKCCKHFYEENILNEEISKKVEPYEIEKIYDKIKDQLKMKNGTLIRLGRYSHCESKTFPEPMRNIDSRRGVYGTSRMIVEEQYPAGWIMIW